VEADFMKRYYLGIDQGGTETVALVCGSDGNISGKGYEAGLIKKERYESIIDASKKACAEAGVTLSDISAVCGGLSGADWDPDYPILTEGLSKALNINAADVIVLNDCMIACRGGGPVARDCAVVCAGTGLNVGVRRADGKEFLYGYFIDNDIQGAGSLGDKALRTVWESYTGVCSPTMLTELGLGFTGHSDAEQLLFELTTGKYSLQAKDFAPFVTQAYAANDYEAGIIIEDFANKTAKYVTTGIKRLEMRDCDIDLVFSGGVFKKNGKLAADRIYQIVAENYLNGCTIHQVHARYEPVCGALLTLLDKHYNGTLPQAVADNFDRGCEAAGLIRDVN
jgi:N-acetylglucosamine kinase-like BadF-type ATPase